MVYVSTNPLFHRLSLSLPSTLFASAFSIPIYPSNIAHDHRTKMDLRTDKDDGGKRLNRIGLELRPKASRCFPHGRHAPRDLKIELCLSSTGVPFTLEKPGKLPLIFDAKAIPVFRGVSYTTSLQTHACSGNVQGQTFKIKVRFADEEDPDEFIYGHFKDTNIEDIEIRTKAPRDDHKNIKSAPQKIKSKKKRKRGKSGEEKVGLDLPSRTFEPMMPMMDRTQNRDLMMSYADYSSLRREFVAMQAFCAKLVDVLDEEKIGRIKELRDSLATIQGTAVLPASPRPLLQLACAPLFMKTEDESFSIHVSPRGLGDDVHAETNFSVFDAFE